MTSLPLSLSFSFSLYRALSLPSSLSLSPSLSLVAVPWPWCIWVRADCSGEEAAETKGGGGNMRMGIEDVCALVRRTLCSVNALAMMKTCYVTVPNKLSFSPPHQHTPTPTRKRKRIPPSLSPSRASPTARILRSSETEANASLHESV